MNKDIKIIVADDHNFFRKGVIMAINRIPNSQVVGEAGSGKELLEILKSTEANVILMDIKMPDMDGIEATEIITKQYPDIKVLALSMFSEEAYLEKMITAGAYGFLLKNAENTDLERAILSIAEGNHYFSDEFLPYFTNKYLNKENNDKPILTKRELEVLNLVALGHTNQQIADKLNLSLRTITTHRANLNSKTGSKNTVNLLTYAIRNKLIEI